MEYQLRKLQGLYQTALVSLRKQKRNNELPEVDEYIRFIGVNHAIKDLIREITLTNDQTLFLTGHPLTIFARKDIEKQLTSIHNAILKTARKLGMSLKERLVYNSRNGLLTQNPPELSTGKCGFGSSPVQKFVFELLLNNSERFFVRTEMTELLVSNGYRTIPHDLKKIVITINRKFKTHFKSLKHDLIDIKGNGKEAVSYKLNTVDYEIVL